MVLLEKEIYDISELPNVAKEILQVCKDSTIFLVEGEMGSGKTTLIKEFCKQLGSKDNFSSPTYAIVNQYKTPNSKIFHFDLYRLKSIEELFDIGFEDYLMQNAFVFIEWPQLSNDFLKTEKYVRISITNKSKSRQLKVTSNY